MKDEDTLLPTPKIKERSAIPEQKLLPFNILQQQVCRYCDQYLTVLPIVVKDDCPANVKCGRHEHGTEQNRTYSMLNIVMENFRFPCINHYEGCQELLDFTTSLQHEQQCKVPRSECPFCAYRSNWSGLLQHISLDHPFNMINNESIHLKIQKRFSQTYVYSIEDSIYRVTVGIESRELLFTVESAIQKEFKTEKIMVSFSFEGMIIDEYVILSRGLQEAVRKNLDDLGIDPGAYCQIHIYRVQLTRNELELCKNFTSLYKCQDEKLDIARKKNDQLTSTIIENEESLKRVFNLTIKYGFMRFECSDCKINITRSIFECPNNHFLCENCLNTVYIRFCSSCRNRCEFTKIDNLGGIRKKCDWIGCNAKIRWIKYIEHKKLCPKRSYTCPDEVCARKLTLEELKRHWHYQTLRITVSDSTTDVLIRDDFFLLHDTELYQVSIKKEVSSSELVIKEIDVVDDKKIKVELFNVPDGGSSASLDPKGYLNRHFLFTSTRAYSRYKLYFSD